MKCRVNTKSISRLWMTLAVLLLPRVFLTFSHLPSQASEARVSSSLPHLPRPSGQALDSTTNKTSTTTSNNDMDYRLEFLHIPKTGGTLIEVIAKEHGVSWGACKFNPPWRHRPRSKSHLKDCPKIVQPQVETKEALWHYPIPKLLAKFPEFVMDDPYDNLPPPPSSSSSSSPPKRKKFFAVIRNPYSWFISLYSMCPPCSRKESLSQYVESYFESNKGKKHVAHCQYEFLYNTSSPWIVDEGGIGRYSQRIVEPHMVVHMERLKEELEALWARHGYPDWKVPRREERSINERKTHKVLSVLHFTKDALALIHDQCHLDFVEGPYDMVNLEDWEGDNYPSAMSS